MPGRGALIMSRDGLVMVRGQCALHFHTHAQSDGTTWLTWKRWRKLVCAPPPHLPEGALPKMDHPRVLRWAPR